MRSKGRIAFWNDDKGYGFVTPFDGESRIFIHIKAFRNRNRRPVVDDVVTYSVGKDNKGRARAVEATLAGDSLTAGTGRTSGAPSILIASIFLTLVGASVLLTGLPPLIFIVYVALSAATFVIYAIDKSAAKNDRWRISEGTLHLLALAGGWPGALVARQTLSHKSRKESFRISFWLTVLVNCAAFAWLHTSNGRISLMQLLTS